MQPLIDAARQGELDLAGQAQLERLLLSYWRERLGLEGQPQAAAVRTMRALKLVAPKKFSEVDEMVDFMGGGGTPLHRASGAMVGSVKNMQKLIENGAKNDGVDRYGQLPIDNLLKFHPDSKAPDILGSGLVPPAEKLRRASKAIMTMNKMNTMTGGKEVLGDEATRAAARV